MARASQGSAGERRWRRRTFVRVESQALVSLASYVMNGSHSNTMPAIATVAFLFRRMDSSFTPYHLPPSRVERGMYFSYRSGSTCQKRYIRLFCGFHPLPSLPPEGERVFTLTLTLPQRERGLYLPLPAHQGGRDFYHPEGNATIAIACWGRRESRYLWRP